MKNKSYALPLAMMFLLYFLIAFTSGLNNPFAKVIQSQFTLNNFESQFGNFAFFMAYLFMGVPSSMVVARMGYKRSALSALSVVVMGVSLVYLGGNLGAIGLYLAGMFVLGCAITVLQVVVNPLVTALGSKDGANSRMNFAGALSSTGATLAPIIVGLIIGNASIDTLSVRDANPLLYVLAGVVLLVFVVFSTVRFPQMDISYKKGEKEDGSPLDFKRFRFGLLAIFLYVGLEVTTANMTNLYMLNELKMDAGISGAIVGTYWLLMLVGRLIGGALGTKVSSRPQLIFVSMAALVLYLCAMFAGKGVEVVMPAVDSQFHLLFATVPLSVLLLVLVGLCNSVMWTCIFIMATDGLGKHTNKASGIFMMMVCGGAVIPAIQGHLADTMGSYLPTYFVGAVCLVAILLYGVFCKPAQKAQGTFKS